MKTTALALLVSIQLLSANLFAAAIVKVTMDSGGYVLKDSNGTTVLSAGSDVTIGDGAVIQLGYFTGATSDNNNFVGNFVPITGQGSANFVNGSTFDTTVGDDGTFGAPYAGQFQTSIVFDASSLSLPAVGTILSIRVFNRDSLGSASNFMTVSNNLWKWIAFADSTTPASNLNISFADAGTVGTRLEDRNGAGGTSSTPSGVALNGDPSTLLQVPEPSVAVFGLLGALSLVARRRTRK